MRVEIVMPAAQEGYVPSTFDTVTAFLAGGLGDLGVRVAVVSGCPTGRAPAIVLAPHTLGSEVVQALPQGTVLYNFEQLGPGGSTLLTEDMVRAMSRHIIWDYSQQNLGFWRAGNHRRCLHVPLGFHASMSGRVGPFTHSACEILFYGSPNDRRSQVIDEMRKNGINAGVAKGYYGRDLDELLSRSRLVINIHYYETAIMEIVRLSHLWANGVPVITELNLGQESFFGMGDVTPNAPYERLAGEATRLLRSGADLDEIAARARSAYAQRAPAARIVERALRSTAALPDLPPAMAPHTIPSTPRRP